MGKRKIIIRETAAKSIAEIAWFVESKGMVATAEKFSDDVYDFIERLASPIVTHTICRDELRKILGLKCRIFRKKFTVVFLETEEEILITEFTPSKLIKGKTKK